jgi:hypothetical protein
MSTSATVKVSVSSGGVVVCSPYCKEFVDFARMRGGTWSDSLKAWMFDARDEIAVRSTLVDVYGTDDYEACQKCDLRVNISEIYDTERSSRITFSGWPVVERSKFDRLRLAEGVIVVSGGFAESGYISRREGYKICAQDDTVVEVRGLPLLAAQRFVEKYPEHAEIVSDVNLEQLRSERAALVSRLEELDHLIETLEARMDASDDDEYAILPDLADDDDEAPEGSGC